MTMRDMRKMTIKVKKGEKPKQAAPVKTGKWKIGDPIAVPQPLSKVKPPKAPNVSLGEWKTNNKR